MVRLTKQKAGFTVLELVLVLVIIGFFAAMVLPRLGGLFSAAPETISGHNMKSIVNLTRVWQQENSGLPNRLINLVNETASGDLAIPELDDMDDEEPETLDHGLDDRLKLHLHKLNADEISELQDLGITTIMMLNDKVGSSNVDTPAMEETPIDDPALRVLMIGAGSDGDDNWTNSISGEHGHPELIYRIVLGIGPDCSLVKDGTIDSAPMCPAAMERAKHVTYKFYCLVLPRLSATVKRIEGEASLDAFQMITVRGKDTDEEKDIKLNEEQESWAFTVLSPRGEGWPKPADDMWVIQ